MPTDKLISGAIADIFDVDDIPQEQEDKAPIIIGQGHIGHGTHVLAAAIAMAREHGIVLGAAPDLPYTLPGSPDHIDRMKAEARQKRDIYGHRRETSNGPCWQAKTDARHPDYQPKPKKKKRKKREKR